MALLGCFAGLIAAVMFASSVSDEQVIETATLRVRSGK